MQPIIDVSNLTKTYATGFQALKAVDLKIRKGEIFALLGPNGAGKTTLINIICGIVALSHQPSVLFLDEPTAGVDVELRKDMWEVVRGLRDSGVTIILTTHYIHEAEDMADRIGVINKGEIILVEDKRELMHKLGKKQLTLQLLQSLDAIPAALEAHHLALANGGSELVYTYDTQGPRTGITRLLTDLASAGISFKDLDTTQSSLEDIFVDLVRQRR
jgi:ABC-2 type transport system ATP-binding protein